MASSSISIEENKPRLTRMIRRHRRERRRPFEDSRFLPQVMKEFLVDESTFIRRFGIDPYEFEELHGMVEGKIRRNHTCFRDNIGSWERLAIVLRFLASGESHQDLSRKYCVPISTIPVMVREVCRTITRHLMPIVMPNPTKKMWEKNAADFKNKFDMPNCIGAIEGKNLFVDGRKIVLLALVDARDRFIMVDVGLYGLNWYRGNVMDKSKMGKRFAKKELNVPADKPITENSEPLPFVILGSSFFPPKPYLMTKYSRPECASNDTHRVFNTRLSRAKVTVNRALLRLRSKWRVFQGPLSGPPDMVEQIVLTCCCLHNFFGLRGRKPFLPNYPDSIIAITDEKLNSLLALLPQEPVDIRDKFKTYFFSPQGQVPWQWQDIVPQEEEDDDDDDDD